jgi:hypothetical protein
MSISSEGEKANHLVQNKRPMNTHEATSRGQPQGKSLIQEVAKRFRREGASGRGCLSLSKPLDLATFRFHARLGSNYCQAGFRCSGLNLKLNSA